MNLLTSLHSIF
jgi:hypothetical protein